MIIRSEEQTRLEFGNGDICVAGGYSENGDTNTGFVIFTNQSSREIGSIGIIKSGEVNLDEYPIIMTFKNSKSIDVVIEQLNKAKLYMR